MAVKPFIYAQISKRKRIFTVLDMCETVVRQVTTAIGEGTVAAISAQNYIEWPAK